MNGPKLRDGEHIVGTVTRDAHDSFTLHLVGASIPVMPCDANTERDLRSVLPSQGRNGVTCPVCLEAMTNGD